MKAFQVKPNKLLKITAKGNLLGHTLVANPAPVDVVVTMGTVHYCHAVRWHRQLQDAEELQREARAGAGSVHALR